MESALVGFFAIFHGHAHGAEMPMDVSAAGYGLGFTLATGLLHVAGIALGMVIAHIGKAYSIRITQVGGTSIAIAGLVLLRGVF
jgi:urease accessory protein